MVESLDLLYHHGADRSGESVRYAVSELRGDWKFQADTWQVFEEVDFVEVFGLPWVVGLIHEEQLADLRSGYNYRAIICPTLYVIAAEHKPQIISLLLPTWGTSFATLRRRSWRNASKETLNCKDTRP